MLFAWWGWIFLAAMPLLVRAWLIERDEAQMARYCDRVEWEGGGG